MEEFKNEDSDGLERRRGEEWEGESGFCGGEMLVKAFDHGQLMDELVDVWNIQWSGQTNACEELVTNICGHFHFSWFFIVEE